jgi:hypothetical protein
MQRSPSPGKYPNFTGRSVLLCCLASRKPRPELRIGLMTSNNEIVGTMTIQDAAAHWSDPQNEHLKRWAETFLVPLQDLHIGHVRTYQKERSGEVVAGGHRGRRPSRFAQTGRKRADEESDPKNELGTEPVAKSNAIAESTQENSS